MNDREKLIELIAEAKSSMMDRRGLMCELAKNSHIADYLMSNGVVIREKGEWIGEQLDNFRKYKSTCPKCGWEGVENYDSYVDPSDFNFCPNCGSDMRGE